MGTWLLALACYGMSDIELTVIDGSESAEQEDQEIEEVPGLDDPGGWLYTLDAVTGIDLIFSLESWEALSVDAYTKVRADIVINGDRVNDIGVRLKGRYGSYRDLSDKAGFLVDFNYFVQGQTFHGLEQLNLNNMVQDPSYLHDYMAYQVYGLLEVPCPRVGYAWVTVQVLQEESTIFDWDYGLYANVEAYDDVFLSRVFEEPDGRLYDGDYWMSPDWSWYSLVDFHEELHDYFELDEGEDVGLEDIRAITAALDVHRFLPDFYEVVDPLVDLDQYTRIWAAEAWVGQYDGYAYNRNNFRVYFDPGNEGRAIFMPWDHDWAFYSGTPLDYPLGRLTRACSFNETCNQDFLRHLWSLTPKVAEADLQGQMDQVIALIDPWIEQDPRGESSPRAINSSRYELRRWLDNRDETLSYYFPE